MGRRRFNTNSQHRGHCDTTMSKKCHFPTSTLHLNSSAVTSSAHAQLASHHVKKGETAVTVKTESSSSLSVKTCLNDDIASEKMAIEIQRTTLAEIEWSGVLDGIPRKGSGQGSTSGNVSPSDPTNVVIDFKRCEICVELISRGYDIRLGEAGRATLKKEISKILKGNATLRDLCLTKVCRLKNANVFQLIQMAEISGCLPLALQISAEYWKDYNRKQLNGGTITAGRKGKQSRRDSNDDVSTAAPSTRTSTNSRSGRDNSNNPPGMVPTLAPPPTVYGHNFAEPEFTDSLLYFSSPDGAADGDEEMTTTTAHKLSSITADGWLNSDKLARPWDATRGTPVKLTSGKRDRQECPPDRGVDRDRQTKRLNLAEANTGLIGNENSKTVVRRLLCPPETTLSRMSTTDTMLEAEETRGDTLMLTEEEDCCPRPVYRKAAEPQRLEPRIDQRMMLAAESQRMIELEDQGIVWKMTMSCRRLRPN